MSKNQTDFKPSRNQLKMLAVMQTAGYGKTVAAACKQAGIGRQTYYDWFRKPGFVTWWTGHFQRYFASELPRIHHAMIESALGHNQDANPQAMKLMMERFDKAYVPRSKQEIDGTMDVTYEQRLAELEEGAAAEAAQEPAQEAAQ